MQGVDIERVSEWFASNVDGATPPLTFDLIAGGHSNLTFAVDDSAGHRYVLRRPPLGHVLATAHDMGREHRIISSLGPTDVPVAPALGLCTDESVNGAPFYVMGFIDGLVVRTFEEAKQLDEPARAAAGNSLVDVLSRIHGADVDAIGLGDLGKRDGYIGRQLKRWYGQFEKSNELTGRPVPLVHEVHDRLAARIPEQGDAAIVHGDYRLDNCLVGPDGEVRAVLDWEICTLGDPLADLGLLLVYWAQTGDERPALPGAATSAPGFPTRDELIAAYADRSTRDLSQLDFYVAFGYWKLACILEGVYSRYAGGAMGDATGFEGFGEQVGYLAEAAGNAADRLP